MISVSYAVIRTFLRGTKLSIRAKIAYDDYQKHDFFIFTGCDF